MKKTNQKTLKLDAQTIRSLTNDNLVGAAGGLMIRDSNFAQCKTTYAWTWCTQFAASECVC